MNVRIERVVLNRGSIQHRVLRDNGGLGIEGELVARAREVLPEGMTVKVHVSPSRIVVRIVDDRSWRGMPWGQRARTRRALQQALGRVRGGRFLTVVGKGE